jgi:hypothetical protein
VQAFHRRRAESNGRFHSLFCQRVCACKRGTGRPNLLTRVLDTSYTHSVGQYSHRGWRTITWHSLAFPTWYPDSISLILEYPMTASALLLPKAFIPFIFTPMRSSLTTFSILPPIQARHWTLRSQAPSQTRSKGYVPLTEIFLLNMNVLSTQQ